MSSSVQEYLTSVLSQRGPSAVPYDEAVKWNVREHVSELQTVFPTLNVKLSEYHSNDGRTLNVLKVEGTIPIHYQGAKYNIPILMWLEERYPFSPPLIYVVPTANMIVRAGTYVNPSGQVTTPLLRSWLYPSSNLVDVVLEMSQVFGHEPPLYTKPPGYVPPPNATMPGMPPQPSQSYSAAHGGSGPPSGGGGGAPVTAGNSHTNGYAQYPSVSGAATSSLTPYATPSVGNTPSSTPGPAPGPAGGWGGAAAAGPYGAVPPPPPPPPHPPPQGPFGLGGLFGGLFGGQQQPPPPPPPMHPGASSTTHAPPPPPPPEPPKPSVTKDELDVHFRHLAIDALSSRLAAIQRRYSEHVADATVRELEVQAQLSERRAQLQATHDALTAERMGTETQVAELAAKTKALQGWLDRNEARALAFDPDAGSVSSHLQPADPLCAQGLETQARDLAVEDAILALDKLLQTGQVPLDAYLKQVRALARKQFFSRALGLKVAVAQQVAAAQQPPGLHHSASFHTQPYPIAHGDSWAHRVHETGPPAGAGMGMGMPPPGPGRPPHPPSMGTHTAMLTNPLTGSGR